jgi:hypothetical protein
VGHRGRKDYNQFLHVKGKSGLKHTQQLLSCWRWHPGFPQLTLVGQFQYAEYQEFLHLPNIRFMPRPTPNDTKTELVPFDQIQDAMNNIGVHVCVSEREGFGHYLNEARALAALVITTDHPPMSEMVAADSGVLVRPYRANSYADLQLLAPYGDINAFVSPFDICGGVVEVLEMPIRQRRQLARRARLEYLAQRRDLLHQLRELSAELEAARQEARTAPPAPVRKQRVAPVLQQRLDELEGAQRKQAAEKENREAATAAANDLAREVAAGRAAGRAAELLAQAGQKVAAAAAAAGAQKGGLQKAQAQAQGGGEDSGAVSPQQGQGQGQQEQGQQEQGQKAGGDPARR